jgi:hypothetical protein
VLETKHQQFSVEISKPCYYFCCPIRLSLSAKSVSHSAVFFCHNKLVNNTFSHGLSAKRTGRDGTPTIFLMVLRT